MKKLFLVIATSSIALLSCGDGDSSKTTTTDTSTTVLDNTNAMDTMNTGEANKMSNTAAPDAETTEFVAKAASGGMMEIELGNIAKEKAKSQRVKDYASMIVTDHTAASNDLKSTASANNISVPAEMMADHRKHIDMMKAKSGNDFDKAYISMMVSDHKNDIGEFKKASTGLKNDAVKSFAERTLPALQKHLDSAQAISKKM